MTTSDQYYDKEPIKVYPDGSALHRVKDPNGGPSFGFVTFEGGLRKGRARDVTVRVPAEYIADLVGTMSQTGLTDRDPDRDELGVAIAAAAAVAIPEMTRALVATVLGMVASQLGRTDPESVCESILVFIRQWASARCRAAGKAFPAEAWQAEGMDDQLREKVSAALDPGEVQEVKAWLGAWLDSH